MQFTKDLLDFWQGLVKLVNEESSWKLIKTVIFVVITIYGIYSAKSCGEHFSERAAIQKEVVKKAIMESGEENKMIHTQQMKIREGIRPEISKILQETIHDLHADRAFIIELHNGSNNTSGLPFLHCTMTYEEVAKGVDAVDEDYQNLTLSRFDFPQYLHDNEFWIGPVLDGQNIDPKIVKKLSVSDVTYIAIGNIKSDEYELGYYGFVYCNGHEPPAKADIMKNMLTNVQQLSKLLDKKNHSENEEEND